MAELTPQERLQPALLDRLTDDEPERRTESRDRRVLSIERLHDCIVRDLTWLLNSEDLSTVHEVEEFPHIASSTLNYGIPALSGQTLSQIDSRELEDRIRESIKRFEPRLLPQSVRVTAEVDEAEMRHNAISLMIEGTAWGQPLSLQLLVKAVVDLETGKFVVEPV